MDSKLEMLVLRSNTDTRATCFRIENRKIGWFQWDYAVETVGDPTLVDAELDNQAAYITKGESGLFEVFLKEN